MTVEEIAEYIVKNYGGSCLACNSQLACYEYEDLVKECEDFFYFEKLNWCGCGDPDMAKRCIRDYLSIINEFHESDMNFGEAYAKKRANMKKRFGVESIYDNELLLCLTYAMDAVEFTEHGSGIGGAWLTNEGKMFLAVLKLNKDLDDDESDNYARK